MKRIGFIGVAAAIAIGGLTVATTPASAQNKPWMVGACQTSVKSGAFQNMGDCLAYIRAGAVSFCSALDDLGYFDRPDARWKNKHICMTWYQHRR